MNYFAATNSYSSETSIGFANTWSVYVFDSKAKRDQYVSQATDISTRAICKKEIKNYVDAAKPFCGLSRRIDTSGIYCPKLARGHVDLMFPDRGIKL